MLVNYHFSTTTNPNVWLNPYVVPKLGQINLCQDGKHAICENCSAMTNICNCGSRIMGRSHGLEKLRTTLPMSCKYGKNGCHVILSLDVLLYHEENCQWRPIFCPDMNCSEAFDGPNVIFNSLEDHLSKYHPDVIENDSLSSTTSIHVITEKQLLMHKSGNWGPPMKLSLKN